MPVHFFCLFSVFFVIEVNRAVNLDGRSTEKRGKIEKKCQNMNKREKLELISSALWDGFCDRS